MNKHTPGPAAEAIANADAHLNDAALPTYSALIERHAAVLERVRIALEYLESSGIGHPDIIRAESQLREVMEPA